MIYSQSVQYDYTLAHPDDPVFSVTSVFTWCDRSTPSTKCVQEDARLSSRSYPHGPSPFRLPPSPPCRRYISRFTAWFNSVPSCAITFPWMKTLCVSEQIVPYVPEEQRSVRASAREKTLVDRMPANSYNQNTVHGVRWQPNPALWMCTCVCVKKKTHFSTCSFLFVSPEHLQLFFQVANVE